MFAQITDWLRRAEHLVPPDDRRVVLSPARLTGRFLRYAMRRHNGERIGATPEQVRARDPEFVELIAQPVRAIGRSYFRLRVEGVDNVPTAGPVLLVGNHNGGIEVSDTVFTLLALHDHHGPQRATYVLTHDILFEDATIRRYALKLGLVPAGHESAHQVFEAGHALLVYPGSDIDTFRPFRDRNKVILAGRTGFVQLVLRERIPIVPLVSAGTHEQCIVLTRGDKIAKRLHMHEWLRTDVFPIVLSVPWGISGGQPYWPLPAQTTIAFGKPIEWPELTPADADRPEVLKSCYRQVETTMQSMLDRISAGRRFLVGTPASREDQ
jgi:1-acyl-sn-glycerol-3-phosphate acyltransferase